MSGPRIVQREYMSERWFVELAKAVAANPRGIQGVADRLGRGCGRSTLSLILSGVYPAQPRKVARRVLEVYDVYPCPHFGVPVQASFCVDTNRGPLPTWDPYTLELRRTCQTCPHRPSPLTGEKQ